MQGSRNACHSGEGVKMSNSRCLAYWISAGTVTEMVIFVETVSYCTTVKW